MKTLSVIIPAYNEEGNLEKVINRCEEVLPNIADAFEIIIVNDGSHDKTGKVADDIARSHKFVRAVHHEQNRGMGAAVATGFAAASYDFLFATPADLQFDIAELDKLMPLIENADIVASYRVNRDYNWYRWMVTYINKFLLRLLFGLKVKDPNWVKLVRKSVLDSVTITSHGFLWDAELLVKAQRQDMRIKEVGVHSHSRTEGVASGASPKAAARTFFALMKFWLHGGK